MRRRRAELPVGLWLALAALALIGIPALTLWAAYGVVGERTAQAEQARVAVVRRVIGVDTGRWRTPIWQHQAQTAFAAMGVEVRLVDDQDRQVYATEGALKILAVYTPWSAAHAALAFSKIAITPPAPAAAWVLGTAALWFTRPAPGAPPVWTAPAAASATLLITLVAIAWMVHALIVRPLTAMHRAVECIAGGDLAIRLPASRAQEAAAVARALEGMSATLSRALEREAALEEERRFFIGAIAHDLRTPLFALRAYLRGLETGVATTPEKVAHYVRACSGRADALERLIADLFAYTRLEYLDQTRQQLPLDGSEIVRECAEALLPLAATKGIALLVEEPREPCMLTGDAALLVRALANVVDNAVRHTPGGGVVRVQGSREDATLIVAIEDSGPGIPEHDLPYLFTPLYRGETSRNRQTGGAGLGLTIARRILQAHGGGLTAANLPRGGARFSAALPLRPGSPATPMAVSAARNPAQPDPTGTAS